MNRHWFRWWWLLFFLPVVVGLARLRFDAEVLDLLPSDVRSVQGLKLYQQNFANARELIITVRASDADAAEAGARNIAERLRPETNLITDVTWQPPWLEHPEQTAELIAHLWLNQPPEVFRQLSDRLAATNLASVLASAREQLSMTLSPTDIAQLSYDPYGLTRLPESVVNSAPRFGQGQELFASADGKFRMIFVRSRTDLGDYRECSQWFNAVKQSVNSALDKQSSQGVSVGYTGRPAFVAEISASMQRDIALSVGGTAFIIAVLFWFAHRRWKPMLWLLTLLGLVLICTLGMGGLIFGTINAVSMGFAAILLGLAVDYAVVHYQEALAHPDLSIPEVRRAIAPSIFWAATTTITAFVVLNFGGLPGLAQLGSLVGVGVALSAFMMIFAFLPPLFPDRMQPKPAGSKVTERHEIVEPLRPHQTQIVFALTTALIVFCVIPTLSGFPKMDASADALQPRDSQAYTTLNAIKSQLGQKREPLWLIVHGKDEAEVARRLDVVDPILRGAESNRVLTGFTLPSVLWPRPDHQAHNRQVAQGLVNQRAAMRASALSGGFSAEAMGLTDGILDTWQRAGNSKDTFWPTNQLCSWIFEKLVARNPQNLFAVGFLFASTNAPSTALADLESKLPREEVWLSSWELLGGTVLSAVKQNLWKLLVPMIGLVLLSLWLAFRRFTEIALSLGILVISGFCLLAMMRINGWSWNLLNLMALPLILGTGVDYSIFMQLALRRHRGDLRIAHQSVGRALLLCGGTAVSGFGSLALSSNAGMASLGQVCAVGIGANMLISVYLLPVWWRLVQGQRTGVEQKPLSTPSSLYGAVLWSCGLKVARVLPAFVYAPLARFLGSLYCLLAPHRRQVVRHNLTPVLQGDAKGAGLATRELFGRFALKVADLWRYEAGVPVDKWAMAWTGREVLEAVLKRGNGVLLVTPHLGNWEFGAALMAQKGHKLLVLTQPEPDARLTEMRQASRARWGIETLVVGEDAFAFVEIIKRLQAGSTVALLVDRPPPATAVTVELFGRPFQASIAAAELARASGCAIMPVYVVRNDFGYTACVMPEITYDRAAIGNRAARIRLTQEILRAFEPAIRQHLTQWYHFVPIWPGEPKGQS